MRPYQRLAIFVLTVAAAILTRYGYLHQPFYADDLQFIAMGKPTFLDLVRNFNPYHINWFYRPLTKDEMLIWNVLARGNPFLPHLVHIMVFGATVYLMVRVAYKVTGSRVAAVVSGAIFLMRPDKDEAIRWICSGSTLTAGLFSLGAIYSAIRWRETGQKLHYALMVLSIILAMISKEDAVTLPLIILVIDIAMFGWKKWRTAREYMPIAIWSLAYLWLEATAYKHSQFFHFDANLGSGNNIHIIAAFYQNRMFCDYFTPPFVEPNSSAISMIGLMALASVILIRVRHHKDLIALTLASLLAILPAPLLVGSHSIAPRFIYVPEIYVTIFWVTIVVKAWNSKSVTTRIAAQVIVLAAIYSFAYLIRIRIEEFVKDIFAAGSLILLLALYRWVENRRQVITLLMLMASTQALGLFGIDLTLAPLVASAGTIVIVWTRARRFALDSITDTIGLIILAIPLYPWSLVLLINQDKRSSKFTRHPLEMEAKEAAATS